MLAEHAENEIRKDFTVSERVEIGKAVEAELKAIGERRGRPKQENENQGELVDIKALLGHVNLATTQIYTHVDQDRMAAVVNKL